MVNPEMPSVRKIVASQIVAVTVYSDKALVTRRGVVFLTGQETELVITSLPDTTETESVRVSGKGETLVRLLEAKCDRIFSTEPVAAKVAHLTQQIQQLEAEWQHLQAQVEALALQSSFIQGLCEKTEEQFSISLARKNLSLSETLDFLNFLGSQYTEYGISTTECKNRQKELEQQLQSLRQQLQTLQTPHPKETYSLSVAIEPAGEGEFELEVSYIVHRASWTPLYDLRLCSTNNIVNLSYLAEVTQNSGEDWLGVALTLSTAKPGLGTLPPKLEPWYIDVPRSNPELRRVRRRTPMLPMTAAAPASDAPEGEDYELPEENFIAAETVVAEVTKQGSVVNFKLNGNGNIPSDGAPHKTTIFQDDFPCHFSYIAMPRLVSFAYLQAHVKNNSNGATLLPGKANIFRDNIFVGTTKLENIAPGQEFKVNLGIDEGLKIERDLIERQVDKKLIGNNSRIIYAYRLLITNLLTQQVDLKLTEQLPVSRSEQIKVRLLRCNPQIQLGEMGRLEWEITIPAQAKQEIYYQFAVEHPPQLTVVGLDI
ncbi:mucoidy inhibitor MuiA family protein [Chlorogloeopsis sp. ULAP01]|uniref:mucoidy inhibitor MuiA family protein n=1 Tax=Chlorogloeopsis sp. ULAP01 TaxID=3056483 RepID=UPI0025AA4452|nr:mucoidy inhibitor MuiA family protein [Chlorogloeopsis sp. ULAP01]MDM9384956.1 mucoidy inhibitor MuiA family protein [Chlorogloeopsis sp. ULAP01]